MKSEIEQADACSWLIAPYSALLRLCVRLNGPADARIAVNQYSLQYLAEVGYSSLSE